MGAPRLVSVLVFGVAWAACGDPALCPSAEIVVIQSPTTLVTTDLDSIAPGVQTDVKVRTSLTEADSVTLDVLDDAKTIVYTHTAGVAADGTAIFHAVTVPTPHATLRATGVSTKCGEQKDSVTIDVTAGTGCDLTLSPPPQPNAYYAPLGVLNKVTDQDPASGQQISIHVATRPGWSVAFYAAAGGPEQMVGTAPANSTGNAILDQTVPEGIVGFRAICQGPDSQQASLATTVFVDTQAPTCMFTNPSAGSSITPGYDEDSDLSNGIQMTVAAHVAGTDVEGEAVTISITPPGGTAEPLTPTLIDGSGVSTAAASLNPSSTPATFAFALATQDHAGNACTQNATFDVVYQGCDMQVVSPTAPVTVDANGIASDGSQVDITLSVALECVGRTVSSACGTNSPSGVVPAGGQLTLRANICGTSPCETQAMCTFHVTNGPGVQTTTSTTITFDDLGPSVSVELVNPALNCGAQITPASDIDPAVNGVQISARVVSANAAMRTLDLTNGTGTSSFDATSDVTVTLAPGLDTFVGRATDALGNVSQTAGCPVTLADLSVSFSPPAADGNVGRPDGTVAGSSLTFPLCGHVNRTGTTVTLQIDGAPAVPATVTGTSWCRTITLAESPPTHTIIANASVGTSFGTASLVLTVDITIPPTIADFAAIGPDRQRIHMTWTAPNDNGSAAASYRLKSSTVALTDANFDSTGTVIATSPPTTGGAPETLDIFPARTGRTVWLGVASVDAAGNRSAATIVGPITPAFDQTGAIVAPDQNLGRLALGAAIAHGRFNDDDFEDMAVAASTENTAVSGAVYIYFGGPAGISAPPGLKIVGVGTGARFGSGLASVRWSSTTRDDLVIGAPGVDGGNGRLYVFRGGAMLGTGSRLATTADLQISVNATMPGWFAGGALGSSVVAADADGDGLLDLVASAPKGGGAGGVITLYGGTVSGDVALSDVDVSGLSGAVGELFQDPGATPNRQFGFYLHTVGKTEGATDTTDDLVVALMDDYTTAGDSLYVVRGGPRPATGIVVRPFTIGRDVRVDYAAPLKVSDWASQATGIQDQDGDGARDLVIGAFRSGAGQVLMISGNVVGTNGVATTTDPGVTITTITPVAGMSGLGSVIANSGTSSHADIDGDGFEDLIVGTVVGGTARALVWFGGAIPHGTITASTATYSITAPALFHFTRQTPQGPGGQMRWIGDINNDGLDDLCWSSPFDNFGDGSFEVLWDQ